MIVVQVSRFLVEGCKIMANKEQGYPQSDVINENVDMYPTCMSTICVLRFKFTTKLWT